MTVWIPVAAIARVYEFATIEDAERLLGIGRAADEAEVVEEVEETAEEARRPRR